MNRNKRLKPSDDAKRNKGLIKLRQLFIEIQNECQKYAIESALKIKTIKGFSERSKSKVIYFLRGDDWSDELQNKLNDLNKKMKRMGFSGTTKPRVLWLPTIIEYATTIQFVIYQAKSVRRLTSTQAVAFANKYGNEIIESTDGFSATYFNGRNCQIRVQYGNKTEEYKFTDMVICLCNGNNLPKIIKRADHTLELIPSPPVLFYYPKLK